MKKYILFLTTLIFCATSAIANNGDDNKVKAILTTVTVYKVGAEMKHLAKAVIPQGNSQLIIENISNNIEINSVQINCNGNVTVMGVEFGTDDLQQEVKTPVILLLEDSLMKTNKSLGKVVTNINIINDLLNVLKANREIKGSQTGLSVAELTKLMDYYKIKSIELQNELDLLEDKHTKLNLVVDKLNNQIVEEQKKNTKQAGRIILQLNCAIANKYDFTISYITQNAYWTPFYDLKADNIKSPLQLIYRAKIYQTTGIDWKQVKLSLSTSSPNESGNAPVLDPWFLTYKNPIVYLNKMLVEDKQKSNADEAIHTTELNSESVGNGLEDHILITNKELNVVFDIDLPYDVPTNGKAQTAILKKYSLPTYYTFYTIPKLDNNVFLIAALPNWEKLNLLAGEANIIFEGTYIGKSFIDPSSTDDTLKLTMGKDKRVVVTREKLMDFSSVKFLGTNKKQIFTYEITVKNNKKDAIAISIKDQYPISKNKEVEVELLESKDAIVNEETGELTWKLNVAAGEIKKLRISYSVKYPKDKLLNLN